MFCNIMNLITELMGKSGVEADCSKPMQLCHQTNTVTNSINTNTSTGQRMR